MAKNGKLTVKRILKSILFTVIGLFLFLVIQRIFVSTMGMEAGNATAVIDGFFSLNEPDQQVFFLGPSHIYSGISPMELYKVDGILSYDLSTPAQTINGSLYFLKELFKKYRPKVIVYDVSPLFFPLSGETDYSYRDIIDNLPMSRNKLELLSAYAKSTSYRTDVGYNEAYLNGLVPLFYYHDRWSQLTAQNFKFAEDKNYFAYGQYLSCNIVPAAFSVDVMNSSAIRMEDNSAVEKTAYVMGEQVEESVPALPLYQAKITEESWKILQEMSQLCRENGSELLLIKVPTNNLPFVYHSAWTLQRSQVMHEAAAAVGLDFLDLMYDVDLGIDWDTDSIDDGMHLNVFGAEKVSAYLGEYLKAHYDLPLQENVIYDRALECYGKAMDVARFQTASTLSEYLDLLKEHEDHIAVFMAACDDMREGLNEADVQALQSYGLQSDFWGMEYQDSFIALIENGNVVYEAVSNREQTYDAKLPHGAEISMTSAGAYCGIMSSIKIQGIEYSRNRRGINIVVYDADTQMVIDSVTFDTWQREHFAERDQGAVFDRFQDYISCIAAG